MDERADPAGPQLPLGISLAPGATFESYFAGPNTFAVGALEAAADGRGERQLLLAGEAGLGKTHLLQAACHRAGARGARCAYLPLDGALGGHVEVLDGLEALDLVALDGLEHVVGQADWEQGLFGLINQAREHGRCLLFAANAAPAALGVGLADLASRLAWGPVLRLEALDETQRRDALIARAAVLGLELSAQVATYLLRHYPRDLASQLAQLDTLDRASLARGRRLTVPFVKEVLGSGA